MQLSARRAALADFDGFFRQHFEAFQNDFELREQVWREWHALISNSAAISMLIEDKNRPAKTQIVGCMQLAFVTDAYAAWARSGISHNVNHQLACPLPDGSPPLMEIEEVARANKGDGVTVMTARWGWAENLTLHEQQQVREFLTRSSEPFYRGYNYKELLAGTWGDLARDYALNAGFYLRHDYPCLCENGCETDSRTRPYLVGITRQEALANEGSLIFHLFVYSSPQLNFSRKEQELLSSTLMYGLSNEEAARLLGLSLSAIKHRWEKIYAKVEEYQPNLLPTNDGENDVAASDGRRGNEKKRALLSYLLQNPQELRPYGRPMYTVSEQ